MTQGTRSCRGQESRVKPGLNKNTPPRRWKRLGRVACISPSNRLSSVPATLWLLTERPAKANVTSTVLLVEIVVQKSLETFEGLGAAG